MVILPMSFSSDTRKRAHGGAIRCQSRNTSPATTAKGRRLYIAIRPAIATGTKPPRSLAAALLRDPVERLGQTLERKDVGGFGALGRDALDHRVGRPAHGLDH